MAPQVTELAKLPLKAGTDVSDPSTTAGGVWHDTLNQVLAQDGAQRAYWGIQVESPNILMLYVDWQSHDAHKNFMASTEYDAFVKRLLTLLDGGPSLFHAPLTPHPATAALTNAPITEVLTVYVPTNYAQADQDKFESDLKQLTDVMSKSATGYKGYAGGWSIEEVDQAKADGGKAKVFTGLVGWSSVQAHLDFREAQEFKDNIHLLREAKDVVAMDVFHVGFLEVQGPVPMGGGGRDVAQDAQEEILNPQDPGKGAPKTGQ